MDQGILSTPLRYPGGKSRLVKFLINYIPLFFEEYREPMIGGGSFFLFMLNMYPNKKYWINDVNTDLYCFWKSLKENGDRLSGEVQKLKEEYEGRGRKLFNYLKDTSFNNEFEVGLRFFIMNKISFSGLVDAGGFSDESFRLRFTNNAISKLRLISSSLKEVKITNLDYQDVLSESGKNIFYYLDPPYFKQRASKLYGKKGIYHTNFDHVKFSDIISKISHNWLLSYDDSQFIRNLYLNYEKSIVSISVSYGMNNVHKDNSPIGKELLIRNYGYSIKL
ncbi:MAG: DNA adenine methylase [Cuniculiplasma sp.]|jgi:DNA adenine methylase